MTFKIGDRVKLVCMAYIDSGDNPLWGGKHGNVIGTITSIDYRIKVAWDNGSANNYANDELKLVSKVREF